MAEMATLHPVSGGFIRMAGKWVDDAFGFMAGWNFFFYEAVSIPFEITAINVVFKFWRDDIPAVAVCDVCIVLYGLINVVAVRVFGEAEFWLSGGKVLLIFILFFLTFVTMCVGNPQHDAYGFWYRRKPGAFATHPATGDLGRFEGFLAALWNAVFTMVGPEYIAVAAMESRRPSVDVKAAFKTVYWRFGLFFILGALHVGIVVAYDDPILIGMASGTLSGGGTAAASQSRNTYTYVSTRTLYGLAIEGRAPRFLRTCSKAGVPIYSFAIVMAIAALSFLSISNSSAIVLNWLTYIITAGGLINFSVMGVTYIYFYRACKAQGIDRNTFPYTGWFQPWGAYIATTWMVVILFCFGYSSFTPWSIDSFFINYTLLLLAPITFTFWELFKRTRLISPHEADLIWEKPIVEAYESALLDAPAGFWTEMGQLVGISWLKKRKIAA